MQTAQLSRDPIGTLLALRRRFGPVFTLKLFPYRAGLVCATDAKTNREVLTDQARFRGGDAAQLIEPVIGPHSLILTPPPTHLRNRKLLLPPFHGERVARWEERIRALVAETAGELQSGGAVAVRPWAQRLTLNVILRVVFGIEDPARAAQFRRALDATMDPKLQAFLFAPEWMQRDVGRFSPGGVLARRRAVVDGLLHEEVAARRAGDRGGRDDVLSVLLDARDEDGRGFSDEELRSELHRTRLLLPPDQA